MITVILVIHLLIAIAMVALILLQRSEGGALGIGGGGGGGAGLMTGRAAGNLLTRGTGILAAAFMATSLTLAILADGGARTSSVLDVAPVSGGAEAPLPGDIPAQPEGGSGEDSAPPPAPTVPSAPLSE
ncbi:preprotein translocase subunit SecG [Roseospira marina]|uniref:Protein-export membrane protein SecG n=1 Tax=Roseospira marina TaxID=140057 RepID=A0A5M6IHP9_9PROT|nr:preprotein translocase subunit SecG [Roseospira marina]KAA5607098.1 preprotein translocase subunit SecG [Roseospira marina]MBB4312709.1 preprotein translocase subunit SecG [Roseospira marina]MBB5086518.1 preprotein translocase subunit SecG [Roseospira marina]